MNFSPLSVSYFPRLPAVNIIFWKKELFSCLSTESQRDPQRDIPSFQSPGSHHLQSEQSQRMTKALRMKTWMKSVVRAASAAWGLKTRRPPATILIPGSRGVWRSRRRGKWRTIGEDRSSSSGQVALAKGDNVQTSQPRAHTCCWQELLSRREGILPKQKRPRQGWNRRGKETFCFFPWLEIFQIFSSHASATYYESLHKITSIKEWTFFQTVTSVCLWLNSWWSAETEPGHILPKQSGFQKDQVVEPFKCDWKTSQACDNVSCLSAYMMSSQCALLHVVWDLE